MKHAQPVSKEYRFEYLYTNGYPIQPFGYYVYHAGGPDIHKLLKESLLTAEIS